MRKFLVLAAAVSLSACAASTATVISSSGPGIAQAQNEPANGPKPRLAVQPFTAGDGALGAGMADMLTDALFNTNKFIVIERERIKDVMGEQDLGDSGRFKKDTVAAKGQLEGAELLIKGNITQFEPECRGGSVVLISAKEACIAINIRILDVATGRVVNATTVEATSSSNGVGLLYTKSDLPIGLGAFKKTPVEKAIRNAVEAAVNHIAATKL